MTMQPLFVGIAGGSGSGKTTVARRIIEAFDADSVASMDMDSYYRDLAHVTMPERRLVNFDHPDAFDAELFAAHLKELREMGEVRKPVYDFSRSTRTADYSIVRAAPIVIVEGILVLAIERVRAELDAKIFVAADGDIRFIRRLERDVEERGRSLQSVIAQYTKTVRPMHEAFVEPSMTHADIIIPRGGRNEVAIEMLLSHLRARLDRAQKLLG